MGFGRARLIKSKRSDIEGSSYLYSEHIQAQGVNMNTLDNESVRESLQDSLVQRFEQEAASARGNIECQHSPMSACFQTWLGLNTHSESKD